MELGDPDWRGVHANDGSFRAVNGRGSYASGWHRDRGVSVCASTLYADRADLEDRVFGALRETVFSPEAAEYVAEQMIERLGARFSETGPRFRVEGTLYASQKTKTPGSTEASGCLCW